MLRLVTTILLSFFCLQVGIAAQAPPIRVMTFNIRYDEPRDGVNAWPNRKQKVADVIRFHKADVVGVLSLAQLADEGVYTAEFKRQVYISSVAGLFRCVRFGTSEAHGQGCAVQLNHLLEEGAMTVGGDGRFGIGFEKIHSGYESLARQLLTIEATGDVAGAETLLAAKGNLPDAATAAIARLSDVPVDIRPLYPVVEAMREW